MEIHRIETVPSSRSVLIEDLPFDEGQEIEIVVTAKKKSLVSADNPYPLRGTAYRYDNPFDPVVSPEDWNALK